MHSKITRHQRPVNSAVAEIPAIVMVIDDDPGITSAVAALLGSVGYSAMRCHSRDESLEAVHRQLPDLVIADINLAAGYSGLELCSELRMETGMDDVPWMFLSGAQTPDIIRRTHETGGVYYLRKPFDPEVLIDLVDKAMWLPESQTAYAAAQA